MMSVRKSRLNFAFCSISAAAAVALSPTVLQAQALDEIIVTAQRREQSLQDVPISIDAISGDEIRTQGFRNMDQLAEFSPSVLIDSRVQDQDVAIRGVGTTGNNLTLEQAAPIFVDGIHFGRTSQIKNAFLDLERVEVLRGPQPVYFGQNATAGAFSLTTRKPGPEWEANISAEVGNWGRRTIEAAGGGPLTDTLGIRVAGKYDNFDGYLTDIISGDRFPTSRDYAGRVILQWAPNDQFEATAKYQFTDYDGGADGDAVRATSGAPDHDRDGRWVVIEGLEGYDLMPLPDSFDDGLGIRTGNRFFKAPPTVNTRGSNGNIDIRSIFCEATQQFQEGAGRCGGYEAIDPWDSYLDMTYRFGNDIELSSLTGYSVLHRSYNRDNSFSPFLQNVQHREEIFDSSSEEIRLTSPTGGAFEWMAGVYWQRTNLELQSDNFRADTRRPRRFNIAGEDAEWLSAFAAVTFNFLDDRASIDVGGRYTDIEKESFVTAYSGTWIFDVEPTSMDPADYEAVPGGWTVPYNSSASRSIPPEWNTLEPVGITPLVFGLREGDNGGSYSGQYADSDFNPQITLRYRPTDNISTYARWAQAFKAGGFDTGSSTIPDTTAQFSFGPEYAENWELGAKGTFWEGRARANLTLFWMEVHDLQLATTSVDPDGNSLGSSSINAGLQRVRGAEFGITTLVSDRLTLGLSGALMDGTMVKYEGAGCTDAEFSVADEGGSCISTAESIALIGDDSLEGLIDRSGEPAPRTPDWIFIADVDYWMPILERYKATLNAKVKASDGYITSVETFSHSVMMNENEDINLIVGFGDIDDVWRVSLWGRNLLGAKPSYNEEFDVRPQGMATASLGASNYPTYGVQVEYSYK